MTDVQTYKWYPFQQNNPRGRYKKDMPSVLWVEAPSTGMADARAVDLGVYFDGTETGEDCSCCGDRWDPSMSYNGVDEPDVNEDTYVSGLGRTAGYWILPWNGPVKKYQYKERDDEV